MSKKAKKSQVASVKTKLLCMDAEVVTNEKIFAVGDKIKAEVEYVDEDNLRITQHKPKEKAEKIPSPERKQTVLARTVHGKMSADKYGVHVGFYFRYDEIGNNAWLGDRLEGESEQMSDLLENMEELVCGK